MIEGVRLTARIAMTTKTHSSPQPDLRAKFERVLRAARAERIELRLYVSGCTPNSTRAIADFQRLCQQHLPGRCDVEIIDICTRIACADIPEENKKWPPSLGLFNSVAATLCYMRHNDPQAKIGEEFGVSQPTISRAIAVITSLLAECTREFAPTADDLKSAAKTEPCCPGSVTASKA